MKKINKILGLLMGLILVVSLASYKAKATDDQSTFYNYAQINKEYKQSVDSLEWPEGVRPPADIIEDKDTSFQKGWGNTVASYYWETAWQKEWLDSYKTNKERAKKALDELDKASSMAYMSKQKCDDATRAYLKKIIDQAKNNDPSGFEENIKLNSPW